MSESSAQPLGVALITGAAQGIGEAIALRLAKDGFSIALNDIPSKREKLEQVRSEIERQYRSRTCIVLADVSKEKEVEDMIDKASTTLGGLDVMVANAGIVGNPGMPVTEVTAEAWERALSVNVNGVFFCYKHAARKMIALGRGGRILGASSVAGGRGSSSYTTSKFAVRGLTQAAAADLSEHNITVNAYAPGIIATAMTERYAQKPETLLERFGLAPPVNYSVGEPETIASLVSYLASKEAHYITGQTVSAGSNHKAFWIEGISRSLLMAEYCSTSVERDNILWRIINLYGVTDPDKAFSLLWGKTIRRPPHADMPSLTLLQADSERVSSINQAILLRYTESPQPSVEKAFQDGHCLKGVRLSTASFMSSLLTSPPHELRHSPLHSAILLEVLAVSELRVKLPHFVFKCAYSGHSPRVHIYDLDASDLRETTLVPEFGGEQSILYNISLASSESRAVYDKTERAFLSLQAQVEEALQRLIDVIHPSLGLPINPTPRIPIPPDDLSAIIKFFVFLRFRNSSHYSKLIKELIEPNDFQLSTNIRNAHTPGFNENLLLSVYSPLIRQVRLQTVLETFYQFFQTSLWDMRPSTHKQDYSFSSSKYTPLYPYRRTPDHRHSLSRSIQRDSCLDALDRHCWQNCREAEIYLGVAAKYDCEFILPERLFGVLDENFGGGVAESESFDCFFPILPTLAVYILCGKERDFRAPIPSSIQIGSELELDIHLRNAMVLSCVPLVRRTEIFIHHRDLKTPVLELDQIIWIEPESEPDGSMKAPSASDILQQLATEFVNISASVDNHHYRTDSDVKPEFCGPRIFFCSLSSIIQSISSYSQFRCNYIDYSRLKQQCRQKFSFEGMKKMWTLKRDIMLSDLTDEVEVIGQHAVAFGAFSDVWMGKWFDAVEGKQRVVAIKYLRQVMVQGVREKLLKRLQAELLTWHQLFHRNLATLYGIVETSTSIGMVSAWCDNGTISDYLKKKPGADRLKLLNQVALGVAYLHQFKPPVIHGDLKGGNILVDAYEQAVITDFGLSKVMEDLSNLSRSSENDEGTKPRSTSSSFFAGSTRWMAPELLMALVEDDDVVGRDLENGGCRTSEERGAGEESTHAIDRVGNHRRGPRVTTASDVYAFASVCLEIITGSLPYPHRKNDYSVTVDILRGVSPSRGSDFLGAIERMFQTSVPSIPSMSRSRESFRTVLESCWDGSPMLRPSMEDVIEYLNGFALGVGEFKVGR
ncbi:hypothetical protein D9757_003679 [Collybiopsis confluens]|uniref:Protein kinase domain-containing protein n=1 Tax=Collybiopsis confluens TaxID=2823264 RepID=A0A8H5HUH0_9AGAR|nr:hypothetical protein D9757_003679 [Collybiopsis confluens]